MKHHLLVLAGALATGAPSMAMAQDHDHGAMDHSAMNHADMDRANSNSDPRSAISLMTSDAKIDCPPDSRTPQLSISLPCRQTPSFAEGSGTARLPGRESAMHGLHRMAGNWMLMAHGYATLNFTDHKGPRGDSLVYSTSMLMLSGERQFGGGRLQLRSMMSLEPTMSARGYPNLFATGETAGGEPLVDRQHPHDLFMELAARIDFDIGREASFFLYGGPVGEPALGPSAFMHRGSAANNPEPPITHHWFDSTHITYGVATAGVATRHFQVEMSAFRGAEPDEERWGIETPRLDSWSIRASWTPAPQWVVQLSHGFLKSPEISHVAENEHRTTASVQFSNGRLSGLAAVSAKDRSPGPTLIAWLVEADYSLTSKDSLFGRYENVDNDELIPDHDDPLHDGAFRVNKLQAGYARHIAIGDGPVGLTLGGSANIYMYPAALDSHYGGSPWGYTLFARLSLGH